MSQHVCSFALYSHDITRQIETHPYVSRLIQDFLQFAVYDSDDSHARLIAKDIKATLKRRGDRLPLGTPTLMMSPQAVNLARVKPEMVQKRDALRVSRMEIAEPEWINPQADYWKQHGKGFAVDVVKRTEVKKIAPFP